MTRILYFIEGLSGWVGKAFAWCILVLTFAYSYEVFMRYALNDPTSWAFDISYIMYGALFMMGGAYTLSRDGHVRGDVFYRLWKPRTQAYVELVLFFLFFMPGVAALTFAGADYALESWSYRPYGPQGPIGEVSSNSPAGVPVAPLKAILPVAAGFLLLQGIAEIVRCVLCIRDGAWPQRLHDVEEIETAILARRARELEQEKSLEGAGGDQK